MADVTGPRARTPWVIDAARTPFGSARGALSTVRADDLAALPLIELIRRHPALDPARVDDVVWGNANGAGEDNRNIARMASLLAGLPDTVPGVSVNRLCGSGAEAVLAGVRLVGSGDADVVIAGGSESMSRAPHVLPPVESAFPRKLDLVPTTVGWRMVNPRFPAPWVESLGRSAELIAEEKGVGRLEQDEWALRSHELAAAAWADGVHDGFAVPYAELERDEPIREAQPEALARLRPAFSPEGSVTAGNSSPISDGAVAALIARGDLVADLEVEPLGRVLASAVVGVAPDRFAIAPVGAIRKALDRAGRRLADVRVLELNEAFSAVVLSCLRELPDIPADRVNPCGGAIAMGHPLGGSAARVVIDCLRHVRRLGGGIGVAAACIGVGQGIAIVVEA
ncbi:thiolase family protein [Gordonia terrae]|uniref:Probable acetyl-CoA acetyltransferase n=2 Tax=Gordonia terrae TaxID=2055 RepID=A0AAD0KCQ9_9ACTN|nr:thiolase family protein [Gordonia terrae]VTR08071.1 acetyl-CoA acetyltransferase [Clostridioides difficile]ANY25203.1 beta-ketoadipyl CoA thiolase [Gordonia terrae]AWO85950.1 acetyl-CoA C-acyltransferase [Gordonia terrae]VTS62164.1 Beta-ketoadipyl-CoA thiolase [Gordonia terrae]GAB45542.1 putative 3-oxoadipyl-CoA thiolase [Gordonia terrae NBRC 100016]